MKRKDSNYNNKIRNESRHVTTYSIEIKSIREYYEKLYYKLDNLDKINKFLET